MDKPNFNIVVTITETSPCSRSLKIQVAAESVQKVYDDAIRTLNSQIRLPGFRAGKVPSAIIISRYAKELEAETIDKLINKALRKALEDEKLNPIGQPELDKDCKLELKLGEPFDFTANIETAPEFPMPEYKKLALTKADTSVTEDEVNDAINTFLENNIDYQQTGKPAAQKDMLKVDYKATIPEGETYSDKCNYLMNGENSWLVLREPELLPGASTILVGAVPGDEKDADITFPKDFYNTELAGKTFKYHIKVNEVHNAIVPELNDEFAKKYKMDSAQQIKDNFKKNMEARKEQVEAEKLRTQVMDTLLAAADFPLPDKLLASETARIKEQLVNREKQHGKKDDEITAMSADLDKQADTQARTSLRREFIITKIAKEEKVDVTFNDLLPVVSDIAQREKKNIKQVFKALQDNHQMEVIGSSIMFTKTLDKIISLADVTVVKDEK
ncbi:MAG: trigger factor [Victivallales bacterium]|nr:trigger factor [Victivallales bacterium]